MHSSHQAEILHHRLTISPSPFSWLLLQNNGTCCYSRHWFPHAVAGCPKTFLLGSVWWMWKTGRCEEYRSFAGKAARNFPLCGKAWWMSLQHLNAALPTFAWTPDNPIEISVIYLGIVCLCGVTVKYQWELKSWCCCCPFLAKKLLLLLWLHPVAIC